MLWQWQQSDGCPCLGEAAHCIVFSSHTRWLTTSSTARTVQVAGVAKMNGTPCLPSRVLQSNRRETREKRMTVSNGSDNRGVSCFAQAGAYHLLIWHHSFQLRVRCHHGRKGGSIYTTEIGKGCYESCCCFFSPESCLLNIYQHTTGCLRTAL